MENILFAHLFLGTPSGPDRVICERHTTWVRRYLEQYEDREIKARVSAIYACISEKARAVSFSVESDNTQFQSELMHNISNSFLSLSGLINMSHR